MNYRSILFLLIVVSFAGCRTKQATTASTDEALTTAYVGTYTRDEGHVHGKAEGIYRLRINPRTGMLSDTELASAIINPSFVVLSRDKQYLYAVSELAHADEPTGFVHAFRITEDGSLTELNKLPTGGQAPCHVEIDKSGKFLFVANYLGGAFSSYFILPDGKLAKAATRTFSEEVLEGKPSWLHSTNCSPDNRIVALVDKGADRVWLYRLLTDGGSLTMPYHPQLAVRFEDGDGPRHAEWSADGSFLYVINELSNTVTVVEYNRQADKFSIIQKISTLPEGYGETNYCADLHLHPSGDFLYGSNRGHNSIVQFAVNKETGLLTSLGHESTRGEYPRNFSIDRRGNFLHAANQNTDNITTYRIGANGLLTFAGQDYEIRTPVCIAY